MERKLERKNITFDEKAFNNVGGVMHVIARNRQMRNNLHPGETQWRTCGLSVVSQCRSIYQSAPKEKPCKCPLLFSNHISISRWTVALSRVIVQIRDTRGHFLLSFLVDKSDKRRVTATRICDCRKRLSHSFHAAYYFATVFYRYIPSGSCSYFASRLSRSAIDR